MGGRRVPLALLVSILGSISACGGASATDGSTTAGTDDTGAEEEGGEDDAEDPGPEGMGCDGAWEDWWNQAQTAPLASGQRGREGSAQVGRSRGRALLEGEVSLQHPPPTLDDEFRATLLSEAAVLSSGRNLAVSWCIGSIQPNPQGPGAFIDPEEDALNLARYQALRTQLERETRTWERHSKMNFVHLAALDDRRKPSGGTCF